MRLLLIFSCNCREELGLAFQLIIISSRPVNEFDDCRRICAPPKILSHYCNERYRHQRQHPALKPVHAKKNKSLSRMHERRHITSTRWAGTVGNVAPRPDTSRIPADEGGRLFRQARRRFLFIYFFFAVYNNDPGRAHSRLNNSSLYTQPRLPITHINCIWRHLYVPVPRLYTDFDMRITHARKSE